ncbi:MAG: hypothetical protein ACJAZ8_000281 [Planctomycetota bacterium]|jgi:hypothetical protein
MKTNKIQSTLLAATLGLTLGFASCAGEASATDLNSQGETALQSQDYDGAKASFEGALAALGDDTTSADYKAAKLGLIESLAHLDAGGCETAFLALAKEGNLVAKDYSYIAGQLASANSVMEGINVAAAGLVTFPEDQGLDAVLNTLKEKAKSSGNAEAISALAGLGYL